MKFCTLAMTLTALAPLAMSQVDVGTPLSDLTITSVTPTFAMAPDEITILGTGLDKVVHVTIGGQPAWILTRRPEGMRVQLVEPAPPGHHDVTVYTRYGLTAVHQTMLYPALRVGISDISILQESKDVAARSFALRLANGAPGQYWVGACLTTRGVPGTYPGFGYGLYLGDSFTLLTAGRVPPSGYVRTHMHWPIELAGTTLHFQGWASQELPGHEDYCFTNMHTLTL